MKTEYDTTLGTYTPKYVTRDGDCDKAYADAPLPPDGDGWTMCGAAIAGTTILWFWTREVRP